MLHFKRTFKASWGIRKRRSLTQGKVRVLGWNFSCVDPLRQIYWDTCVLTAEDSPDGRRARRTAQLWIFSCVYTAKFPSPVDIKHVRQRWTNKDGSVLFWFSFLGAWDRETFKQRGLRGSRGLCRAEWSMPLSIGYLYSKISRCCSSCWLQNRGRWVNKLSSIASQMLLSKYFEEGPWIPPMSSFQRPERFRFLSQGIMRPTTLTCIKFSKIAFSVPVLIFLSVFPEALRFELWIKCVTCDR